MTGTDAQVMERSRTMPSAFEAIVHRHHDAIYRYIARRLGSTIAEDLASDVFTTAFSVRARYDVTRDDARPWLYGITTNLLRRHAKREAQMMAAYARLGRHPETPETSNEDLELGSALAAAVAAMRRQHRDAFLLHVLVDLTYAEIAEAMGVPIGTVRGWINRARVTATRELALRGVVPAIPEEPQPKGATP